MIRENEFHFVKTSRQQNYKKREQTRFLFYPCAVNLLSVCRLVEIPEHSLKLNRRWAFQRPRRKKLIRLIHFIVPLQVLNL